MNQAFAWNNDLQLKGGINASWLRLSALNDTIEHAPAAGFNTHFGYKWDKFEFSASSYINFSGFTGLDLKAQGVNLDDVSGDIRNLSIVPLIKYHTDIEVRPSWRLYVGAGPSWSLLTMQLEDDITGRGFGYDDKFVYESRGASLVIGVEEQTLYKEMRPVFFELLVQYMESHELTTVDASNNLETIILSKEEIGQIDTIFYMLSMGIVIF